MNDSDPNIQSAATWLYEEYCLFYEEFLKILDLAKLAFEKLQDQNISAIQALKESLNIIEGEIQAVELQKFNLCVACYKKLVKHLCW